MTSNLPTIDELLAEVVAKGASDLHLKPGVPPTVRIDGILEALEKPSLDEASVERYLEALIPERLRVEFKEHHEADFAYGLESGERFRINAFQQRGLITIAIRALREPETDLEALGLPPVVGRLAGELRGLLLVTGPTGSGKSTTLAALIDMINTTRRVNIITIEDPVEVVHEDKMALVSQREVGRDVPGFARGLRDCLAVRSRPFQKHGDVFSACRSRTYRSPPVPGLERTGAGSRYGLAQGALRACRRPSRCREAYSRWTVSCHGICHRNCERKY